MNKETLVLMVLPPVFMALGMAVHVGGGSLRIIWVLISLSVVASVACLVRGINLLRNERPVGYLCAAAAVVYVVLLVIMLTPAKTKAAAQPIRSSQQPPPLLFSAAQGDSLLSGILGAWPPGGCG